MKYLKIFLFLAALPPLVAVGKSPKELLENCLVKVLKGETPRFPIINMSEFNFNRLKLMDGAREARLYIHPQTGQKFIVRKGDSAKRELAADVIDQFFDFTLTPKVEMIIHHKESGDEIYAFMKYIDSPKIKYYDDYGMVMEGDISKVALNKPSEKMTIFDMMIGNMDRALKGDKGKNYFILHDSEIDHRQVFDAYDQVKINKPYFVAYDNSLSFYKMSIPELYRHYDIDRGVQYNDEIIKQMLINELETVEKMKSFDRDLLRRNLEPLLHPLEIDAFFGRIDYLLNLVN